MIKSIVIYKSLLIALNRMGFPDAYIFLTREQEQFIIELFENERYAVKEALLETVEEMKGLIDEL